MFDKGESIMICKNCENEIPDEENEFCPICGSKTEEDFKENESSLKTIRIAVVCLLVFLIIINLLLSLIPIFFY